MKKPLAILLLIPVLLSGCDFEAESGSMGKFEDSLTFYQKIDNKTPYINRVINATNKYVNLKMEMKEVTLDSEMGIAYDVTAYANEFVYAKIKESGKNTDAGITIDVIETGEVGLLHDGLNNILNCMVLNDGIEYSVHNYDEDIIDEVIDAMYTNAPQMAYGYLTTCNLYSNKAETEFTFAESLEDETYTPLAYGFGTFMRHDIEKVQTIVKLNKDFSIKTVSYYSITQTNIHPDTNEYLDEMLTTDEGYLSIKFSYGQRKENASLKNKFLGYFNNPFFLNEPVIKLDFKVGDESGYSDDNQEATITDVKVKTKGTNDFIVKGDYNVYFPMSTSTDGARTNVVVATVEVPYTLHYYDDPLDAVIISKELSFNSYESEVSKIMDYNGTKAILTDVEILSIHFEFEMKVNSDGELSISNEKYFAY